MKKLAYVFGILGFLAIFILSAFEKIMMSVNSYGLDAITSIYLFFAINIVAASLLVITYLKDRNHFVHISFNLNNKGVAFLYLVISILSILLLINSNSYSANSSNVFVVLSDFIQSPQLYLPILPVVISGLLFVITSKKHIQKLSHKKKVGIRHVA